MLLKIANGHVISAVKIQRVTHILIVELVTTVMMENATLMVSSDRKRSLIVFYIKMSNNNVVSLVC